MLAVGSVAMCHVGETSLVFIAFLLCLGSLSGWCILLFLLREQRYVQPTSSWRAQSVVCCLARWLAHYALGGYMGWAAVIWAYFLSPAPCPHSGPTIHLLHPQGEWGYQEGPVVTSPNPLRFYFCCLQSRCSVL